MLAQNFLTPAQLQLTPEQHSALVTVLGMLERGEVEDLPPRRPEDAFRIIPSIDYNQPPRYFYMPQVRSAHECGSAACMEGWAEWVSGNPGLFINPVWEATPLTNLFGYQNGDPAPHPSWRATVAQAAMALRSYLTTGEANWAEALRT